MIYIIATLLLSFFLIWKGSDWITDSLVPVAQRLGTSYIAVTTILVSLMLSLPEIISAVYTSVLGQIDIGLGVIVGSVMMNIGLGVGLSAMIKPLTIEKAVVLRDGLFMVIAAVIVLVFGSDLQYTASEGWVLLLIFVPYIINVWSFEKWRPQKNKQQELQRLKKSLTLIGHLPWKFRPSIFTFAMGAVLLLGGAVLFSFSLVRISELLPIPGLVIGFLLGAIGTGIPNLAASLQATRKGFKDVALTETFGSNIITLLLTLGILVILKPFAILGRIFYFDLTWMIVLHLLLLGLIIKGYTYKEASITRYEGLILVLFYITVVIFNLLGFP
jgi:cation:H+ antiporter